MPVTPILGSRELAALRVAVDDYTVEAVDDRLGLAGRAALDRGDLTGARRACAGDDRVATLTRLFVLGGEVDEQAAAAALRPLTLTAAVAAGLVEASAGRVRAALDLRPYGQDGAGPWWVVSDLGADVRPGPLRSDHVLGVGAASLTLAQATPRAPVGRALDLGTGCGVQALHLGVHASSVTATDVSARALRYAATTAALSGQDWDLRLGSLADPVLGDAYDLVVANPPFVVSPGGPGYDYRDSGLAGDAVSRELVRALPRLLRPAGTAQLLANWAIGADGDWRARVSSWLAGSGCDAWVWQREVADPGEYVSLWLRDAGEIPGTARWEQRYTAWRDWFDAAGVLAVGMGVITMWRTGGEPVVVLEDVPQAIGQPIGAEIAAWPQRRRRLAASTDADLLDTRLWRPDGLVRSRDDLPGPDGWATRRQVLRQSHGMRWEVEIDDAFAAVVAGCSGEATLRTVLAVLADAVGADPAGLAEAAMPVVRDLVGRGFLDFAPEAAS